MFGRTTIPQIGVDDASHLAEDQVLLDVRELDEWAAGHAPHAVHLPMSQLHPDRLPAGTLLCICRSGNRSGQVVAALRQAGYDAVNVAGGMHSWQGLGLPVVRDDGRPGTVI
jgi:rhodanese-related sulfurtransferase